MNLMWFRSDLRVYDNPALSAAMAAGPTIAVYVTTPGQWRAHDWSPAKRSLTIRQAQSLARQLDEIHVPFRVLSGDDFSEVPSQLMSLASEQGVRRLFFNDDYGLNEQRLSEVVTAQFEREAMSVKRFHDQCLVPPGHILTKEGQPYKVFSAFKKALLKDADAQVRTHLNRPPAQNRMALKSDIAALERFEVDPKWAVLWPAGEDEAHDRLARFIDRSVLAYDRLRDFPGHDATSVLSPYLSVGALSVAQCLHAARSLNEGQMDAGKPGVQAWINELLWREFYRHLLALMPDLSRHRPFKAETDQLPWRRDDELFGRWCQGETGYPLVDAAMHQLRETGWMHNRLRMVTAMFLSKHLFIDWRWGERFFMQHLVDGDLASNNGGWQWSASTGVDAAPYFRVFNPARQSERFDPQGVFIRRFEPRLRALDNRSIHQPRPEQARALNYPSPMVEHRQAVAEVKAWFKNL